VVALGGYILFKSVVRGVSFIRSQFT
jgi:hypothetical protein